MTLKEIGSQANALENYVWINLDASLNKLTQEIGEFNDAVQKYRWIYCKTKTDTTENIEWEIGDVLFNIISILNRLWIDPDKLPEFAGNTLKKAEERKELYKQVMSGIHGK